MAQHILAVNAGSSSLKIALFRRDSESDTPVVLVLTSSILNISSPPAKFTFQVQGSSAKKQDVETIHDHESGFTFFIDYLDRETDIQKASIVQICHRVVHGGDFTDPVIISDQTYHHIERLSDLAPLSVIPFFAVSVSITCRHNGSALAVIKACIKEMTHANSIAFFDTAFHRSIPHHIASFPVDQNIAKKRGLKKYGFHGLSCTCIGLSFWQQG